MKVTISTTYTVPAHCISSTTPSARIEPKTLSAGRQYDCISWSKDHDGNIDEYELYIGRRWYLVPARVVEDPSVYGDA